MTIENGCAICYENFDNSNPRANVPCCEVEGTSVQLCMACVKVICDIANNSENIGKCPRCSSYIKVLEGKVWKSDPPKENLFIRCRLCNQKRAPSNANPQFCNACFLGLQNPLRYECQRCHHLQVIHHPMYRYQASPSAFGTATWACHQRCGEFTHWRILSQDVDKVPFNDVPDSWQEHNFGIIRQIRRNGV